MRSYDDWKLDTPDNHVKVIGDCVKCGCEIYKGENTVERWEGYYHEECYFEEE